MSIAAPRRVRPGLDVRSRPLAGMAALAVLVAAFAAWTGLQITALVLDETVYKYAATQYADGVVRGVLDDRTSRGIARLYALVIAPAFWLLDGDVAVRVARALNACLFAATALPVFALARRAGASPRGAAAAGVLSVAVPWLTLSTILFSESLALLLFACTVLAVVRALEQPSRAREAVVLALLAALVLTRMQLAAASAGWLALAVATAWRAGERPWRRYPLTLGVVALAVLAFAVAPRTIAGPYFMLRDRVAVPGDFGQAVLWEAQMLAIGVGVVPALLAAAWFAGALRGRLAPQARAVAVAGGTLLAAVVVATLWAQGGWLGMQSEERYFLYVVPFLWVGAAAALAWRDIPLRWAGWSGAALAAVIFLVPNPVPTTGEQMFLGPVSGVLNNAMPRAVARIGDLAGIQNLVSGKDLLGLAALAVTALALLLWRRGRWPALVPAVAIQVLLTAYAFAGVHGRVAGIGSAITGGSFAERGWVDRALSGGQRAAIADDAVDRRDATLRDTVFWNDAVDAVQSLRDVPLPVPPYPVSMIEVSFGGYEPGMLIVPPPSRPLLVQQHDSPLWQVAGRRRALSPDGRLELLATGRPARLRWLARGLLADGHIPATGSVGLHAPGGTRVALTLAEPTKGARAIAEIGLGGRRRRVDTQDATSRTMTFDLCRRGGEVVGEARPLLGVPLADGRASAGLVRAVSVTPCG